MIQFIGSSTASSGAIADKSLLKMGMVADHHETKFPMLQLHDDMPPEVLLIQHVRPEQKIHGVESVCKSPCVNMFLCKSALLPNKHGAQKLH